MRQFCIFALILGFLPTIVLAEDKRTSDDSPPIELFLDEDVADIDPSEWNDPIINKRVSFELLGTALSEGNAVVVTDIALELAEAERILLRNHPKVTSATLFLTALTIAQKNADKKTLDRLQKVAKLTENDELISELKLAATLGGSSRAAVPPPSISLEIKPEQLALAQKLVEQIEVAENTRDKNAVQELRLEIVTSELPQKLGEWLNQLLDRAEGEVGKDENEEAEALSMLAGTSRGWFSDTTGFRTPTQIQNLTPGVRPNTQSNLGGPSGLVPSTPSSRRPSSSSQMSNYGYKRYGNVNVDGQGNVYIGGQYRGQAQKRYNSATGQHYYDYRTKYGGRVVRQSNGNTWVRPSTNR